MTDIVEDLLGGTTNLALSGGFTATRSFFADAVIGNADAIQFQAIQNGQIPKPGDPHPTIPLLIVNTINATSVGKGQVKLTVNYEPPRFGNSAPGEESQTQITIGATVKSVQTNFEFIGGNLNKEVQMELKYRYPVVTKDGVTKSTSPNGIDKLFEITPTVTRDIPLVVATLSRKETGDPAQKANDFVGTLNSRTFIGSDKGWWMCTKIGGPSPDGGFTFNVGYEFVRMKGGWLTTTYFIDENTGLTPSDANDFQIGGIKTAVKTVRTQPFANFDTLKLGQFSK